MKMPPHIMALMVAGTLVGTAGIREMTRPRPLPRSRRNPIGSRSGWAPRWSALDPWTP